MKMKKNEFLETKVIRLSQLKAEVCAWQDEVSLISRL